MNIVEPIFAQCRNKPAELAFCAPGTEFNLVSYARLERSVNNICRHIIAAGIAPRSRIAVLIQDPVLHAMVVIALTRLGVVTVSTGRRDIRFSFKLDGAIADREYEAFAGQAVLVADATWTEGDGHPVEEKHLYHASFDDPCGIFVAPGIGRAGTAVAMTHGMMMLRLDRQKLFLGPRAPFCDRTHLELWLGRPIGFQIMFGMLWRGGALFMTGDPQKALAAIATYKVQNIVGTPRGLLKLAEAIDSSAGYHCALTAVFSLSTMERDASDRVRTRLCSNLTVGYVTPDSTMVASMPVHFGSGDPASAGYLLPDVMLEVVDDQDHALPQGHDGNLRLRSEYGVTQYFEDPEATRRAFRNGWFYPAERGHLTADNMLVLSNTNAHDTTTDGDL